MSSDNANQNKTKTFEEKINHKSYRVKRKWKLKVLDTRSLHTIETFKNATLGLYHSTIQTNIIIYKQNAQLINHINRYLTSEIGCDKKLVDIQKENETTSSSDWSHYVGKIPKGRNCSLVKAAVTSLWNYIDDNLAYFYNQFQLINEQEIVFEADQGFNEKKTLSSSKDNKASTPTDNHAVSHHVRKIFIFFQMNPMMSQFIGIVTTRQFQWIVTT